MFFAEYLKRVLKHKQSKNRSFSLRSFARFLGISSGRLSEILNGKAGVTKSTALKMADKLGLIDSEKQYFVNLAIAEFSQDKEEAKLARLEIINRDYTEMNEDLVEIISDWRYLAILEALKISNINAENVTKLAKQLNVSFEFVAAALSRLERSEQIFVNEKGYYEAINQFLTTKNEIPSSAIRNCHKNLLIQSIESLEKQDVTKRDHNSNIISISEEDILFIKKEIEEFVSLLTQKINLSDKEKSKVYSLNVSFFELLQRIEE